MSKWDDYAKAYVEKIKSDDSVFILSCLSEYIKQAYLSGYNEGVKDTVAEANKVVHLQRPLEPFVE